MIQSHTHIRQVSPGKERHGVTLRHRLPARSPKAGHESENESRTKSWGRGSFWHNNMTNAIQQYATIVHSMPSSGACIYTVTQATVMTFNKADTVNVYTFKPWNFQQLMTSLDRNCLVSAAICCLGNQCNSHVQHIPTNHSWEITTCIVDLPAH